MKINMIWIIFLLFIVIGVLNIILVHPVPGIIYIVLSMFYFPPFCEFIKRKLHFSMPIAIKVVIAVFVLWFTLGVGDLMELFEAWMNS